MIDSFMSQLEEAAKSFRSTPIKLTSHQWTELREQSANLSWSPDPYLYPPSSWAMLTGVPIQVIEKLKDCTPVVEGWISLRRARLDTLRWCLRRWFR